MAQVTINGLQLSAYYTTSVKRYINKNDVIRSVDLVYFNCTKFSQRDEEGFFKAFQTNVIEGFGYININEEIQVVVWTADKTKFEELSKSFEKLLSNLVNNIKQD